MRLSYGRIYQSIPYHKKDYAKNIPYSRWHPASKEWSFPLADKDTFVAVFPEYEQELKDELQRIKELSVKSNEVRKAKLARIDLSRYTFKLKPFEHQVEMIKYGLLDKKFAYLCEMGTGKTKVVIDVFNIFYIEKRVRKCLVVCPKSVLENWGKEVEANSDHEHVILYGTKKQRETKLAEGGDGFYIINYEGILVLKENKLLKQFDMVVLDESSKIKSHDAQRTKLIIKLFKDVKHKYIMTGTPITQNPCDIFPQFKFLSPDFLGFQSYYTFRNSYCIMGGYGNYEITGYRNLHELRSKIAKHSIQLKKEECVDLPEKLYEKRTLIMHDKLAKQYNEMKDNLIVEISEDETLTASIIITKLTALHRIASGVFVKESENEKIKEARDIIENTDRQIIIWARFTKTIELLEKTMIDMKIPYSIFQGSTTNRQEQIDKFQDGTNRVFLGQIQTGGMGITLTQASIVVYYENTFSLENRLQSEDRAHRIGQKNKVTYVDLVYKDTIDDHILKAIHSKQDISKQLVSCFKGFK